MIIIHSKQGRGTDGCTPVSRKGVEVKFNESSQQQPGDSAVFLRLHKFLQ